MKATVRAVAYAVPRDRFQEEDASRDFASAGLVSRLYPSRPDAAAQSGSAALQNPQRPTTMMYDTDQLVTWLSSAFAMERALEQTLENHAKDAGHLPDVRDRIEQHIRETRRHAEHVSLCLEQLGEKPSSMKSWWGMIGGKVQGASTGMYDDEIVKNALADYAAEHFEIACYTSLIAAAEDLRQDRIAEICREILREEEAMADWLRAQIPTLTRVHIEQTAEGRIE